MKDNKELEEKIYDFIKRKCSEDSDWDKPFRLSSMPHIFIEPLSKFLAEELSSNPSNYSLSPVGQGQKDEGEQPENELWEKLLEDIQNSIIWGEGRFKKEEVLEWAIKDYKLTKKEVVARQYAPVTRDVAEKIWDAVMTHLDLADSYDWETSHKDAKTAFLDKHFPRPSKETDTKI